MSKVIIVVKNSGNIPIINRRGPVVNGIEVEEAIAARLKVMGYDVVIKSQAVERVIQVRPIEVLVNAEPAVKVAEIEPVPTDEVKNDLGDAIVVPPVDEMEAEIPAPAVEEETPAVEEETPAVEEETPAVEEETSAPATTGKKKKNR
jgi:hypothetical protein